ncbi:hypothetical protein LEP1GSC170_1071 [Leptospira interrogans serovar Bataviae str. HAI135]|nr:hypothetical protein LEP1GSC170_1071 [Leptospira interrogans serovar Bataviae str. HAI135]
MLGKNIFDPYCIESNQGHIQGISLLQIETILEKVNLSKEFLPPISQQKQR